MVTYELTANERIPSTSEPDAAIAANLQTLWQQIKQEFYASDVCQHAIARLQQAAASTAEEMGQILGSVAQEALRIAFQATVEPSQPTPATEQLSEPEKNESVDGIEDSPLSEPLAASDPMQTWLETMQPVGEPRPSIHLNPFWKWQQPATRQDSMTQRRQQWEAQVLDIVGQLRQARETQGLTLEQLHRLTKITAHQLRILESGNLEEFPEEIYVRGFIRRIGNALGLDGIALAQALPSLDWHETRSVLPSWRPAAEDQRPALNSTHLYIAYAALMAGAVGGLAWTLQGGANPNPAAELPPLPEPVTEEVQPRQELGDLGTASLSSMQEVAQPEVMPF